MNEIKIVSTTCRQNETSKQQKETISGRVLLSMGFYSGSTAMLVKALQKTALSPDTKSKKSSAREISEANHGKLSERSEQLRETSQKAERFNNEAAEVASLSKQLKESLKEKNKSIFGGLGRK